MANVILSLAVSIPMAFSAFFSPSPLASPTGPQCHVPVAYDDAYSLWEGTTLDVPATGVLANDTDAANLPLTAQLNDGPTHGTLILNPDGSFSYTPADGFSGEDTFTYHAKNTYGLSASPGVVTLTVKAYQKVYLPVVQS